MKRIDRVILALLTIGIWVFIFTYVFSPNLTKAQDPFFDNDDFGIQKDFFSRDIEGIVSGYIFNGNITIQSMPIGEIEMGRMKCKVVIKKQ